MSYTCVRYMGVSSTIASNDWFCELTAGTQKVAQLHLGTWALFLNIFENNGEYKRMNRRIIWSCAPLRAEYIYIYIYIYI
jgi:hypothetical protein